MANVIDRKTLKSASGGQFSSGRRTRTANYYSGNDTDSGGGTTMSSRSAPRRPGRRP